MSRSAERLEVTVRCAADRAPGRPQRPWPRRWVVLLLALGVASALVGLAIVGYRAAPRIVTGIALRRARELAAEVSRQAMPPGEELFAFRLFKSAPPFEKKLEEASVSLAADFGGLFRAGYFEPAVAIGELPREGFSPDALPFFVLCGAYAHAIEGKVGTSREVVAREAARWVSAVCRSAGAKECIVHILVRDLELVPGRREPGGFFKLALMAALTCRDLEDLDDYGWGADRVPEVDEFLRLVLERLAPAEWEAVVSHCRHEREGVRAGALLLLCHHPRREVFTELARGALQDASQLVRLAAAAALAYHRDASGAEELVAGLEHERWEVRWWCARSLAYLTEARHLPLILTREKTEPDPWVRREVSKMEHAWPRR